MRHVIQCILLSLLFAAVSHLAAQEASITVQVDKLGAAISPLLYGVFFEEIHRAGEGGVYAEKVMNRSFEEGTVGWSVVQAPGSAGTMEADRKSLPINPRNPTALKLTITEVAGGQVGVANGGFLNPANGDGWSKWFYASRQSHFSGFDVRRGSGYRFSLYARSAVPLQKPLGVTLERSDGTVLAASQLTGVGTTWMQFTGTFTSAGDEPNARLVVAAGETGTLWLDMVSVFPVETYRGLPFRTDLMEMLAAMKPGFLRFPGGTFIQGNHFEEAFHWKETIGDVAQRVARPGFWGYTVDRGMGFHEYLLMAEALGAEPLFCCYAGMGPGVTVPMDKMQQLVQDALDAIEYANGDAQTTTWGAERAKNGHATSFHLKLIEIGNENWGATYRERYLMFFNAIKARYPYVRIITSEGALVGGSAPVEILDKHHYEGPDWFVSHGVDYLAKEGKANIDNYAWLEANPELGNMGGAKVGGTAVSKAGMPQKATMFIGEYASVFGCGMGSLQAAVAEGAFLTGMENLAGQVEMTCYAPFFSNAAWVGWWPSAVVFDSAHGFGTASYHVQALFGRNRADMVLPVTVASPDLNYPYPTGTIGVGLSGDGVAEFKDITAACGGTTLYSFDPAQGLRGWLTGGGTWQLADGAIRVSPGPFFRDHLFACMLDGKAWRDVTLTLKVRRLSGQGEVDILFNASNPKRINGWSLGAKDDKTGVANTQHGVRWDWHPKRWLPNGGLENGRWYDVRVEVRAGAIHCFLDNQLKEETFYPQAHTKILHVTAGRIQATGETVMKVVNVAEVAQETIITLAGMPVTPSLIRSTELSAEFITDVNTFDQPTKIAPREHVIPIAGSTFTYTFPASSVTVLRIGR